jgi:hypothetical protein
VDVRHEYILGSAGLFVATGAGPGFVWTSAPILCASAFHEPGLRGSERPKSARVLHLASTYIDAQLPALKEARDPARDSSYARASPGHGRGVNCLTPIKRKGDPGSATFRDSADC